MKMILHHEYKRAQDGRWVQVWRETYSPTDLAAHAAGERQTTSRERRGNVGTRVRTF